LRSSSTAFLFSGTAASAGSASDSRRTSASPRAPVTCPVLAACIRPRTASLRAGPGFAATSSSVSHTSGGYFWSATIDFTMARCASSFFSFRSAFAICPTASVRLP
jgi:hypothetical protein